MKTSKKFIQDNPFPVKENCFYLAKELLECHWICHQDTDPDKPAVMEFMLEFKIDKNVDFTIHVSSDQQYILSLDKVFVGRGCEMKSPESWFFESYDISLEKGMHCFTALVWNYGKLSPMNRMSIKPGFILIPDSDYTEALGTGVAPWKVRKVPGVNFKELHVVRYAYISVPPYEILNCSEFHKEEENKWLDPVKFEQGRNGLLSNQTGFHLLKPSMIKEMFRKEFYPYKAMFYSDVINPTGLISEENNQLDELKILVENLNKKAVIIPANSTKRIIFALDNYYCAYTSLKVHGGKNCRVKITWAEAAFTDSEKPVKAKRNTIIGKYFRGVWDEFILDGEDRTLQPLSWRAGRFIEIQIVTQDEALTIDEFILNETRYPLEMESSFSCNDEKLNNIISFSFRALQVSALENFVDCPFYEQLLYAGDGRLEALVNLVTSHDNTLIKKALLTFSDSRDSFGVTMARWPSTIRQYIPSFSLWWVGMIYDYALWRGDKDFIKILMPGIRFLLEHFINRFDQKGFIKCVDWEWNFIDWVDEWRHEQNRGTPEGINFSINATFNWLFVYILKLTGSLEEYVEESLLAERWRNIGDDLSHKLIDRFWDSEKNLFKEDDSGNHFSEHCQVLAILSGKLTEKQLSGLKKSLFKTKHLARCSIFYKHYLFEVCNILGASEKLFQELKLWNSFLDEGFLTVPETPENSRSDCHGWGAHSIYHLLATVTGIRPAEMGFKKVIISPMLGHLNKVKAECIHPAGMISVQHAKTPEELTTIIKLPEGLSGIFKYDGKSIELHSGEQTIIVATTS